MGAIINIFKNIIGLITGLFGGKKGKDGFFLEAPAAPAATATPVATSTASEKAAKPAAKAKGKAGKAAAVAAAAAAVAAAPVVAQPVDPTELIRAAVSSSSNKASSQAGADANGSTFAEMNAVPFSNASRRRPGANMTGFLDMAKTMKQGR